MSTSLPELRTAWEAKHKAFQDLIASKFPGCDEWWWYRALSAVRGENGRRNDDTQWDAALAADAEIKEAHDAYIKALHVFYRARDGEGGVLGGRGL